jgi:hypothetical protein
MYEDDFRERIYQGDLYENLILLDWVKKDRKSGIGYKIRPYVFILSQECDLKFDFESHNTPKTKHSQFLNSILCCPAYRAELVIDGTHLIEYEGNDYIMVKFVESGKKVKKEPTSWRMVKQNKDPRYHHLDEFEINSRIIPELILDFKHYYSIPRDMFYYYRSRCDFVARLKTPFKEFISQRFAYYFSRIGLPELDNEKINCDADPCNVD